MWRNPVGEGAKRVTMESVMKGADRRQRGQGQGRETPVRSVVGIAGTDDNESRKWSTRSSPLAASSSYFGRSVIRQVEELFRCGRVERADVKPAHEPQIDVPAAREADMAIS